jgi:hypothetical protein
MGYSVVDVHKPNGANQLRRFSASAEFAWLCALCLVWKPLWMLDDLFREIDIDVRPVEVARRLLLNIHDYLYRLILEPREFVIWHEQLLIVRQQPNSMSGNVRYLNYQSSVAMH